MPDGSRTQTGCLTCRIRKKKCDEQRPVCQSCRSRQLTCYGYNEPAPSWCTDKANWNDVKNSDEARNLRTLAETRYKVRRKVAFNEGISSPTRNSTQTPEEKNDGVLPHHHQLQPLSRAVAVGMFPSSNVVLGGTNIWQLRPDTIWWDSKIRNLAPDSGASNEKTRLLMLFLEVIHPMTHSFYKLDYDKGKSWMLNRLIGSKPLYDSALSISACFDTSLTQPPSIDNIGLCPKVSVLQSMAVRGLKNEIDKFVLMESTHLEEFIWTGIQLLDVITNLQTLEIFSMLQGYWEMHHRAARRILNHVEMGVSSNLRTSTESKASLVEAALSIWPPCHERRRSLKFCITNYIWIDVLAITTFGVHSYDPCAFDYLGLLQSEKIKPQNIMGCQGWIMGKIVEIANFEQRKETHQDQTHTSDNTRELLQRDKQIVEELNSGIDKLERDYNRPGATALEEDSRLISILWAYGAQVFRQKMMSDLDPKQPNIDQTFVNICLEKLEELPTRLVMRSTWPYTIAGCMSTSQYQHERFRRVFGRTMQEAHPPGISWKGLIVMEECWKLRQVEGSERVGWRETMEKLGARVILT